ncbi:unnamed protein product [Anisakis simplex]|uniref:ATP synthase subunit s, mitochondrial n=1 Tax=Anisakis simplex TaxID=6269 RepID=A0A0M3J6D4_ANISI|nr:unnamed protein product [Anisakis simplex]
MIRFDKLDELFVDYNELIKKTAELDPRKESEQVHVISIDATDSSVTGYGCRHFVGLKHLQEVRFIRCNNLHDYGLEYMGDAVGTILKSLHIESCKRITEFGLENLVKFSGLKSLTLQDLKRVHDANGVLRMLTKSLPHCDIRYTEAKLIGS